MSEQRPTIDAKTLKAERDRLKSVLHDVELEQRKVEKVLKTLRQQEIGAKRSIEALETLLDVNEADEPAKEKGSKDQASAP
jgi:hypothetical protein